MKKELPPIIVRLKDICKKTKTSYRVIAEMAGVSESVFKKYCNGTRFPSYEVLTKLHKVASELSDKASSSTVAAGVPDAVQQNSQEKPEPSCTSIKADLASAINKQNRINTIFAIDMKDALERINFLERKVDKLNLWSAVIAVVQILLLVAIVIISSQDFAINFQWIPKP